LWRTTLSDLNSFRGESTKTLSEKLMKAVGVLGWSLAYIVIICAGHQAHVCFIHREILAYNLVWEAAKAFIWTDDRGISTLIGIAWFGFDLEILRMFFLYGDDPLHRETTLEQFQGLITYIMIFSLISVIATNMGEACSRIWRHSSQFVSVLIQLSILRCMALGHFDLHMNDILGWSMMIGNIAYLVSVWRKYVNWYKVKEAPIRFFIVTFLFAPSIIMNALYLLVAHGLLVLEPIHVTTF